MHEENEQEKEEEAVEGTVKKIHATTNLCFLLFFLFVFFAGKAHTHKTHKSRIHDVHAIQSGLKSISFGSHCAYNIIIIIKMVSVMRRMATRYYVICPFSVSAAVPPTCLNTTKLNARRDCRDRDCLQNIQLSSWFFRQAHKQAMPIFITNPFHFNPKLRVMLRSDWTHDSQQPMNICAPTRLVLHRNAGI